MAIDQAGHDVAARMVLRVARGRRRALADGGDGLAADGDIAAPNDLLGGHNVADEDAIERIRHFDIYPVQQAALAVMLPRP